MERSFLDTMSSKVSQEKCLLFQIILSAEEMEVIRECARQLDISDDTLKNMISALATVLNDSSFVAQVLAINARINTLAEAN